MKRTIKGYGSAVISGSPLWCNTSITKSKYDELTIVVLPE
jgi:hypothetical protein